MNRLTVITNTKTVNFISNINNHLFQRRARRCSKSSCLNPKMTTSKKRAPIQLLPQPFSGVAAASTVTAPHVGRACFVLLCSFCPEAIQLGQHPTRQNTPLLQGKEWRNIGCRNSPLVPRCRCRLHPQRVPVLIISMIRARSLP